MSHLKHKTVRNILCYGKYKIDNKSKSGVYKRQGSDCNNVYIGHVLFIT